MKTQGVASVGRALKILFAFQPGEHAISLAEIARRTKFYRSTILRLTETLCEYGFLVRLSDGTFCLGSQLLYLGMLYKDSFHLEEMIVPALKELVEATGETARFSIRQGKMRTGIFQVSSPHVLREHINPGELMPFDDTSTGQVFSLMQDKVSPKESHFPIYTEGVIDPLTASCAAPLISSSGVFVGVITVSGPKERFTMDKRIEAGKKIMKVIKQLSFKLGGLPKSLLDP